MQEINGMTITSLGTSLCDQLLAILEAFHGASIC